MKLALSTSHILLTAGMLALAAGPGCGTRKSIGEGNDAGPGGAPAGEGAISGGTGGSRATGGSTGSGGVLGPRGSGGSQALGGHTGGSSGAPGGSSGAAGGSGGGGAGGSAGGLATGSGGIAAGGIGGLAACQSYPPQAQGGQGGRLSGCAAVVYPPSGFYGDNILADGCTQFIAGVHYEIAAQQTLTVGVQVVVTALQPAGPVTSVFYSNSGGDWLEKNNSNTPGLIGEQLLFQSRPISENEVDFQFMGAGMARVDIYDCDPSTPSRSKIVSWGP